MLEVCATTNWKFVVMTETNILDREYNTFMEWLKENHPETYKKYKRNFDYPNKLGGGVTVNNSYQISSEEFGMLHKIAKTFYK
jgi:hypothetical protein